MHLHHMAVTVRDLEAMKQFYMTYFGGTPGPLYHNPTSGLMSYFLSFDGEARLELMTRPGLMTGDADAPPTGYAPGLQRRQPGGGGSADRPPARGRLLRCQRPPHDGRRLL